MMTLILVFNIITLILTFYILRDSTETIDKPENRFAAPNKYSAKYYECMKFADHKLHSVIFQSYGELANYMPPIPHA